MSKGWKRFLIICGSVFVVGFLMLGVGILFDGHQNLSKLENQGFFHYEKKVLTEKEVDEFHTLEVDVDYGDVQLIAGEEYKVEVFGSAAEAPTIEAQGNRLVITSNHKGSRKKPRLFLNLFDTKFSAPTLKIYYPKEEVLKKVDIETSMGSIDAQGCQWEEAWIFTDYGDIICEGIQSDRVELETDMGDVQFQGTSRNNGSLHTDMGDVEVDGTISGEFSATTEMGDLEVTTVKPLEDYNYSISTELGDIEIAGQSVGNNSQREDLTKENRLILETEVGDIQWQTEF